MIINNMATYKTGTKILKQPPRRKFHNAFSYVKLLLTDELSYVNTAPFQLQERHLLTGMVCPSIIVPNMRQTVTILQCNVAQLLKEPLGSCRDFEVKSAGLTLDGIQTGPMRGKVKLIRTNRSILAQGKINSSVKVECSRCLKELDCPLAIDMEEEYLPTIDVLSGRPLPLPDEPGTFTIDDKHTLDLTEAVRQYLLLGLPMKPLCRADCAGLCLECGRDLNQGPCGCPAVQPDPRWAKLAQLASARGAEK
jgi:uncharacterized protein